MLSVTLMNVVSGNINKVYVSGGCNTDPDSHSVHHLPFVCYDAVPALLSGLW